MYTIRDKIKALIHRESQVVSKHDTENLADQIEKQLSLRLDKEAYATFLLYRKYTEMLLDRYGPDYAFLMGQLSYTHNKKLPSWDDEFSRYEEENKKRMDYLKKLLLIPDINPQVMKYDRLCTLAIDFCIDKYKEWFLQGFGIAKVQEEIKILE